MAGEVFLKHEIEALSGFYGLSDKANNISAGYCAHLLSRIDFFSTIPWQKRIQLCGSSSCVKVQAQDGLVLGPGTETDKRVAEAETLIVLSGSSSLQFQSGDTLTDEEENPPGSTVIECLNPGTSIVLSTLENRELHKQGRFCARTGEAEAIWMLIPVNSCKGLRFNDMKLGRRAITLLSRSALMHNNLSECQLASLVEACKLEKYPAGTKLLRSWEPAPCIYFVESGECVVQTQILGVAGSDISNGQSKENTPSRDLDASNLDRLTPSNLLSLTTLKHGECFGEASAISNQRMWASLVTKTDCKVWSPGIMHKGQERLCKLSTRLLILPSYRRFWNKKLRFKNIMHADLRIVTVLFCPAALPCNDHLHTLLLQCSFFCCMLNCEYAILHISFNKHVHLGL